MKRRPAAILALSTLVLVGSLACDARSEPTRSEHAGAPPTASPRSATASREPLAYVERCPSAGCDARLPLLVVLHGLGDTPEAFLPVYEGLRSPVRVVALRAPLPWGDGRAWFPYRSANTPPETIAAALEALVPRVTATIDAVCAVRACDGRVVVSGFSQGGMMSYAVAALAPARIALAIPIGGFLVPGIEPARGPNLPRIVGYHGDVDRVVRPEWDEAGAARLSGAGYPVDFHIVPGVGHAIPPVVRAEVLAAIDSALPPQ